MTRTLKPITKPPRKNKTFTTFDIEAHHWTEFLCIGFYDGEKKHYKQYESLKTFCLETYVYCGKHKIENTFGHFAGIYDFNFLLKCFLMELSDLFEVESIVPRGSGILCFTVIPKKGNLLGKHKLVFRDSSAIFPMGLAILAKSMQVKTEKGSVDFTFLHEAWQDLDYTKDVLEKKVLIPSNSKTGEYKTVKKYLVKNKTRVMRKLPKKYKLENINYLDKITGLTYKIDNRKDIEFYLYKDCVSLYECLDAFYNWDLIKKVGGCITTASQAVKVWQYFLKKPIGGLSNVNDKYLRGAYFGGRTEVFQTYFDNKWMNRKYNTPFSSGEIEKLKIQNNKKLSCYDVNSLYPTIMEKFAFPISVDGHGVTYDSSHYQPQKMGVWEVTINVPKSLWCPPLGLKHTFADGSIRFIFPTGKLKGKWTVYEIEYAKSLGCKVLTYHSGINFVSGGKIFKTFINTLYNKRLEAKKNKDRAGDLLCKLLMNSCYGKIGMITERENLVIDNLDENLEPHSTIKHPSDSSKDIHLAIKQVNLTSSFTNVMIPLYVTSYSRVEMHKHYFSKCKPDELFYCDTDSLFTTKKFKTGSKLGELKEEYSTNSACFLLPKTYIIDNMIEDGIEIPHPKIAMKGFAKKRLGHFTFEDFTDYLRNDIKELKIIQQDKFATFKTALKRGTFLDVLNDPERELEKDKRKITEWTLMNELVKDKNISWFKKQPRFVKLEIKNYKDWLRFYSQPKLKERYDYSTKAIKSSYNKRLIEKENKIMTRPIHL